PVTFSDNRHKRLTTNAHELALGVAFESGILHLADAVESYKNIPEAPKRFLKTLPVTWDETKLLAGSPTEDVLLARRKGATWYIGYLNGTDKQKEVAVDFSFLEGGSYIASLIKDGNTSRSFAQEEFKVDNKSTKSIAALPNGGFVMVLEKP
ncbi:MAG: glycoside hydrolase family 97 C-terminal domain-containing protein, partial [Bacteroidetes bacterium]|nr:glycoside hydrolase family 97 C-terminal domain-containing protein [Bacteroidota bacterium]